MDINEAASDPSDGSDARERSLIDDLQQLAEDARQLAEAEFAYQKTRAAFAGRGIRRLVVLGALAAVLVFFALMVLAIGLVLALTPLLTAWGAAGVAFGGLLLVALLCAMAARSQWKRMAVALGAAEDQS